MMTSRTKNWRIKIPMYSSLYAGILHLQSKHMPGSQHILGLCILPNGGFQVK